MSDSGSPTPPVPQQPAGPPQPGYGQPASPAHSGAHPGYGQPTSPQHSGAHPGYGQPASPQHSGAQPGYGPPIPPSVSPSYGPPGANPASPTPPYGANPSYGAAPYDTTPGMFAAPYTAPVPGSFPSPAPQRSSSTLGMVALLLALAALVIPSIVAGIAGFQVGAGVGQQAPSTYADTGFDLRLLTPVRNTVLIGEISFWGGTVLGVWALVQGIVATVRRRGRGTGIAAIVVALLAAIAFAVVAMIAFTTGVAVGAASALGAASTF